MLAARALGVPVISIGQGHSTPPAGMAAYPADHGPQTVLYDERALTDIVNRAGRPFGLMPLEHFSDVYRCDAQLPRTIAALDPYAPWRNAPTYLPPLGLDTPHEADGRRSLCLFLDQRRRRPRHYRGHRQRRSADAGGHVQDRARICRPAGKPRRSGRTRTPAARADRPAQPHDRACRPARRDLPGPDAGHAASGAAVAIRANRECAPDRNHGRRHRTSPNRAPMPPPSPTPSTIYADAAMAQRARDVATTLRPVLVGDTAAILRATVDGIFQRLAA